MGTTSYGGEGSMGRAANGDRLVGASCRREQHTWRHAKPQRNTAREDLEAKGCCVPPLGKRPRKWPSQGPPAAVGERYLTAGLGWPLGRTWPTAKACALLCVDSTQRSETGQVRGLRWHNRPREREGKECGEADGHRGLRRERPRDRKEQGKGTFGVGRKRKVTRW